jgi:signal recognition particle GTPase
MSTGRIDERILDRVFGESDIDELARTTYAELEEDEDESLDESLDELNFDVEW